MNDNEHNQADEGRVRMLTLAYVNQCTTLELLEQSAALNQIAANGYVEDGYRVDRQTVLIHATAIRRVLDCWSAVATIVNNGVTL